MSKPKLLVVPNDPLEAYDIKGYSRKERNEYFNPNSEFDVSILSLPFSKNKGFREFAGFPVYNIGENLEGLDKTLREIKPDLVRGYGNGTKTSNYIGKIQGIPSFTSVHDMFPKDEVKNADRVFAVSNAVKNKCIQKGVSPEKIRILEDRVDLDIFKDYRGTKDVQEINSKYPSKNKIVSSGRLVWEKNLENLVEASNMLKEDLGDLTHLHVGNLGDSKERIFSKLKKQKSNHIHFLNNVNQETLAKYFSWGDVFSMASVSEGFGLVYTEALACNTPVITSNIAPMNEYLFHGYNGLLADPRSPEDIAEKTKTALTDKDNYRNMKNNARESVKKFDKRVLSKKEAKLYKEVL